eukprot:COSAG04_NODE_13516_length_602_cov_1.512922_1_plen_100_part_10
MGRCARACGPGLLDSNNRRANGISPDRPSHCDSQQTPGPRPSLPQQPAESHRQLAVSWREANTPAAAAPPLATAPRLPLHGPQIYQTLHPPHHGTSPSLS